MMRQNAAAWIVIVVVVVVEDVMSAEKHAPARRARRALGAKGTRGSLGPGTWPTTNSSRSVCRYFT